MTNNESTENAAALNTSGEQLMMRISELGTLIADSAEEMERLMRELQRRADQTMVEAAGAYVTHYPKGPIWSDTVQAQDALVKASIAASNIKELMKRSTSLRSASGYFGNLFDRPDNQYAKDARIACNIPAPTAQSPATPRHNRSR